MKPDIVSPIHTYVEAIRLQYLTGHAKEHGYRPALERLMASFPDAVAVNDPRRSQFGNPDFIFLRQSHQTVILGYAEAKDIDIDLDKTEKSNQMQRYGGYDNLYLTNYLEFRFFRNGDKYKTISIGEIKNGQLEFSSERFTDLLIELQAFLEQPPEIIRSGSRLAQIMGAKSLRIRNNVTQYLGQDDKQNDELEKIYKMMRTLLVHDLTTEKFADMYAQTLVYGLFVARYNAKTAEGFDRKEARDLVPASNPFLREFFDHIVGPHFDTRLGYIVDELCEVFRVSDVQGIVHKHLKVTDMKGDDKDPIIHFYEDFLKSYDPEERKRMGAYYTPIPVVRFIVRSVDEILRRDFGLSKGLADTSKKTIQIDRGQHLQVRDQVSGRLKKTTIESAEMHSVQILDPAVGTATFLNEIIKFIYQDFVGQEGRWPSYVENDLLPRLYGFELMMAPYTIAHLKLGMTLQEMGVKDFKQRLGVYLTNTLEEGVKLQTDLFSAIGLAEAISKEADEAAIIKSERPIMVIVGNPPYSVSSNNKSEYIQKLVQDYKKDLNERKTNLDDDYIKFIRFAEEMIAKNGEGVVSMITNNSFIDGGTHRQMRKHLLDTFDSIYILDLHGSTKKREVASDGGKDENVFAIQQGVSISIFVKTGEKKTRLAKLYHSELFGTRKSKFNELLKPRDWQELVVAEPGYYFVPKDFTLQDEYDGNIDLGRLFIKNSSGVETAKDSLIVQMNVNEITDIREDFRSLPLTELRQKYSGTNEEKLRQVQADIGNVVGDYTDILYRPFDVRHTLYSPNSQGVLWRPRAEVMRNFVGHTNLALLTCKRQTSFDFQHAFMAETIAERCSVSLQTGEVSYVFPLYLYHDDGSRTPNFNPEVLKRFSQHLTVTPAPEDILDYIYAILHSPSYRAKYKEFLKIDFPKVPVPAQDASFQTLVTLGKELRNLHLMKSPTLDKLITTYPVGGSDEVEKVSYEDGKVWINSRQYFGDVPVIAWEFYIGGYQPAQKWLKDRKGHSLSSEDLEHYQKIIKVLIETNQLMQQINEVKL